MGSSGGFFGDVLGVIREGVIAAGSVFSTQQEQTGRTQQIDASARAAALLRQQQTEQIQLVAFALVAALGVFLIARKV